MNSLGTMTFGSIIPSGTYCIGLATISGVVSNINLASSNFIGLVSTASIQGKVELVAGSVFVGLVSTASIQGKVSIVGNVTLSSNVTFNPSSLFIGLATVVIGGNPSVTPVFPSNSTIFTGILSGTGNTTIAIPPSTARFSIKNMLITTIGSADVEIRSGATMMIPFMSFATQSGIASFYGDSGLPARAADWALVVNKNSAATISYMFDVMFR